MKTPGAVELRDHPIVRHALAATWADSLPGDPLRRHEEGGWIYCDTSSGEIVTRRASPGLTAAIDLNTPPEVPGAVIVAIFHTHPNPIAEGWNPGPSRADENSAWILGVPCIIAAEDGVYLAGPPARRGGLKGNPGFPD